MALTIGLVGLLLVASSAQAAEAPSHPFRYEISLFEPVPKLIEDLEGPCGLAVDSFGNLDVANYYHDQIDAFGPSGNYINRMLGEEPLDGPCALALDSGGNIYVDNLHRNVLRFALAESPPGPFPRNGLAGGPLATIDTGHSTGLALDPTTGDLFVDDRTYVAEYRAPIFEGETPLRIGEGSLGESFGLAVSGFAATEGLLYVPDAATDTVKVLDPSLEPGRQLVGEIDGAGTPQGGFTSLHDAAVAVDDSDGHVFLAENLQPLDYEHPAGAVEEFDPAGELRGELPGIPPLFASAPTGLAIDDSGGPGQGDVYVTSGNSELAKVYAYGPTGPAHSLTVAKSGEGEGTVRSEPAGIECASACAAEYNTGAAVTLTATPAPGSAFAGWSGGGCAGTAPCHLTLGADSDVSAEFEALPPVPLGIQAPAALSAAAAIAPAAAVSAAGPPAPHVSTERRHRRRTHHRRRHRLAKKGSE